MLPRPHVVDRWSIAGQAAVLVLLTATAGTGIVSSDLFTGMKGHNVATLSRRVVERQGGILGGSSFARRTNMFRSIDCRRRAVTLQPPSASVPDLPQTRERVGRRYDCQPRTFSEPFLGWLVAEDVPLSTLSHYQVLHRYRGGPVEADHPLVPCTVSALVFSLCQQSRLVRGGPRRLHRRTPGLHVRKSSARAGVGRGEEAWPNRLLKVWSLSA